MGKEGSLERGLMTQGSESRKEAARPTPLLTPKTTIKIGTWNVRTMYETGRTAQVAKEMRSYNISLLGLSETRWLQAGQLRLATGEMLLYSGHTEDGAPHTEGVAMMLSQEAQRALIGWEPVNSLIITAKFATKKNNINLNVIQCYAPTNNDAEEERKDDFYQRLQAVLDKRRNKLKDITLRMGDLNAKVRADNTGHEEKFRRLWSDVRVMRGADVSSDHHLLVMSARLRLKKYSTNTNPRKRFNVGLLKDKDIQTSFKLNLSNRFQPLQELLKEEDTDIENQWQQVKKGWLDTCEEVFR
ncbi:uncharacterized protein LOC144860669 [Branchiostoma floridae x Branchiostoma japonicum]